MSNLAKFEDFRAPTPTAGSTPQIADGAGEAVPEAHKTALTSSPVDPITITEIQRPAVEQRPPLIVVILNLASATIIGIILAIWVMIRGTLGYLVRHPIHAALNMILLTVIALVVITGSEIHTQMILGKISDQTIDRIISGSRFTRPYDAEEVNRTGTRELIGVGAPEWMQREAVRAVLFHARKAGLSIEDQAVVLATVDVESGFNPMARAPTSSACGLFQFIRQTGETFGLPPAKCMDPWLNAQAGIAHYIVNMERRINSEIQSLTGAERVMRSFELSYYLHHDGPASSNPSNDVKAVVLNGTQFLFKTYHALQEESESQNHAPSFGEQFELNLMKLLDSAREFLKKIPGPWGEAHASESAAVTPQVK